MRPPANAPTPRTGSEAGNVPQILLECAVEAFVQAILVLVLGSVALSLAGGLLQEMAPSAPPILKGRPWFGFETPAFWNAGRSWVIGHKLPLLAGIFFVLIAWSRLVRPRSTDQASSRPSRIRRASQRFSEDWFSLIVGNTFAAFVGALVLYWVQRFSISQWFYRELVDVAVGNLQGFLQRLLGITAGTTLRDLLSWFGDNQFRFTFWFLYLAAICDDLGLPNLKTLARWTWRRFRNRGQLQRVQDRRMVPGA